MQALAAELSGYAGKFRCFLERRVFGVAQCMGKVRYAIRWRPGRGGICNGRIAAATAL